MKKFILSLLFCFAASSVFAVTAEEVLRKSEEKNLLGNLSGFQSYEVEYERITRAIDGANVTVIMKETVDGANRRMDVASTSPKMDGYVHYSLITADGTSYVSAKYVNSEGGGIVFADYKMVNDTSSVSNFDKNSQQDFIYSHLIITFDSNNSKNKEEYIINMSVDREKLKKSREERKNSGEQITAEEFALAIISVFDSKIFIDRNTLLANATQVKFAEEGIYETVSESEEHKDKSEEERRKTAKEIADNSESFGQVIHSDYKQVEGTKLFYPAQTRMQSPMFAEYYPDGVYAIFKINSFRVLNPDEIDPSTFIPANIKKGKGKVPKEFTQRPDIYGEMKRQMKKEIMKSLKESIKESAKEGAKDMLKDGAKSVFKGLGKF